MPTNSHADLFQTLFIRATNLAAQNLTQALAKSTDPVARAALNARANGLIHLAEADLAKLKPSERASMSADITATFQNLWEVDPSVRKQFSNDREIFDAFVAAGAGSTISPGIMEG